MQRRRLTGLAAQAVEFRDKVCASADLVRSMKSELERGGEGYHDGTAQCEAIERLFDRLSDAFIDLSVVILKADKSKEILEGERANIDDDDDARREKNAKHKE